MPPSNNFWRFVGVVVVFVAVTTVVTTIDGGASASAAAASADDDGMVVVQLTDGTFEHQTQASTGMTTGSWFVLFEDYSTKQECGPTCQTKISSTFSKLATTTDNNAPELEEEEVGEDGEDPSSSTSSSLLADQGILFASVDCETSPKTCKRFNILPPALLYFHKKAMYPYPGGSSSSSSSGEDSDREGAEEEQEFFTTDNISEELVRKFVLEDFKLVEGMEIPPPPSPLQEVVLGPLLELYEVALQPENRLLSVGIGGMAVMLLGTVLVLIKTLLSSSPSSSSKAGNRSKKTITATRKKTKKS